MTEHPYEIREAKKSDGGPFTICDAFDVFEGPLHVGVIMTNHAVKGEFAKPDDGRRLTWAMADGKQIPLGCLHNQAMAFSAIRRFRGMAGLD